MFLLLLCIFVPFNNRPPAGRCQFRRECIRRLLKGVIEAHPHCWQPLNWGRFEDSLQLLTTETADVEAINAHAAAVSVTLDCVEAHRRRAVAKAALRAEARANVENTVDAACGGGGGSSEGVAAAAGVGMGSGVLQGGGNDVPSASMIASLFLGAGGSSKDGREAVKKCAR